MARPMSFLLWIAAAAPALPATAAVVVQSPEIVVTARTPLSADASVGQGGAVSVVTPDSPATGGSAVLRSLEQGAAGVSVSDAHGSPFQRSVVYRGFQASPLQGAGQGL